MKVFLSCDIEGTNGICSWDETEKENEQYLYYAEKMTQEVKAVCDGINQADPASQIYVKDAHDSARNIDHQKLPENVLLNRGWGASPYTMMLGIDSTYDASIFTGYHSAGWHNNNPLAHTMSHTAIFYIKINGEIASEFLINYYASLYNKVPVVMVSGDEGLMKKVKEVDPNIYTVASLRGAGNSVTSEHPNVTLKKLQETACEAVANKDKMQMDLPDHFDTEICFRDHKMALRGVYYPGAHEVNPHTVGFRTDDYFEFLKFIMFVNA